MQVVSGADWAVGPQGGSGRLTDRRTLAKLGVGLRGLYQNLTDEPLPTFLALFVRELEEREPGNARGARAEL
jgi:hypothetical protein